MPAQSSWHFLLIKILNPPIKLPECLDFKDVCSIGLNVRGEHVHLHLSEIITIL